MIYLNSEDISVKVTPENKLYPLLSSLIGQWFYVVDNNDVRIQANLTLPVFETNAHLMNDVVNPYPSKVLSSQNYEDNPVLSTAKIAADILKSNDMSFLPETSPHRVSDIELETVDNIYVNKLMKEQYSTETQNHVKSVIFKNFSFLGITKGYKWFLDRNYKEGLMLVHDKDKFVRLVFEA